MRAQRKHERDSKRAERAGKAEGAGAPNSTDHDALEFREARSRILAGVREALRSLTRTERCLRASPGVGGRGRDALVHELVRTGEELCAVREEVLAHGVEGRARELAGSGERLGTLSEHVRLLAESERVLTEACRLHTSAEGLVHLAQLACEKHEAGRGSALGAARAQARERVRAAQEHAEQAMRASGEPQSWSLSQARNSILLGREELREGIEELREVLGKVESASAEGRRAPVLRVLLDGGSAGAEPVAHQ